MRALVYYKHMRIVNTVIMSDAVPTGLRTRLLRLLGVSLGEGSAIASRVMIKGKGIKIGLNCFVNHGCHFDRGPITLGNRVYVGPGVTFVSTDHVIAGPDQRAGKTIDRPICIGDGAWLGANSVILGGVNVAKGCIVAAGAVVTKDTKPNGLYAGIPARRIRDLEA